MGGVHEKVIYWRELSKKGGGAWTFCRFKGRLSKKEGGRGGWGGGVDGVFDTQMHTMLDLPYGQICRNRPS